MLLTSCMLIQKQDYIILIVVLDLFLFLLTLLDVNNLQKEREEFKMFIIKNVMKLLFHMLGKRNKYLYLFIQENKLLIFVNILLKELNNLMMIIYSNHLKKLISNTKFKIKSYSNFQEWD